MSVRILIGDCRARMAELDADSVDSCVTDPPYHLTSIVKRFGAQNAAPAKVGKTGAYARASRGFMGQTWDGGDVAFDPETWAAVLRVLKPGAHLVAFGGTRTFHRLVTAIEDAGFEIRDTLFYLYGSGFPKSHSINKKAGEAVCRCPASDDTVRGLREPEDNACRLVSSREEADLLAAMQRRSSRAGLGEARPQGICGSEADARHADGEEPRLEGRRHAQTAEGELQRRPLCEGAGMGAADGEGGRLHHGASAGDGSHVWLPADPDRGGQSQGPQPGEQRAEQSGALADECGSQARGAWPLCPRCGKPIIPEGLGTALKPAVEPICLARKPISEKNVAANVLQHGTGAINIDGCRVEANDAAEGRVRHGGENAGVWKDGSRFTDGANPMPAGRWPANIIHDGSEEVLAEFPDTSSGYSDGSKNGVQKNAFGKFGAGTFAETYGDSGSAARFFYCAKATSAERGEGNNHPTVKPVALMQWLCRLVTPKGGLVLDPFAGSGSTLIAAQAEQFDAIGCELSPEYAAIAEGRVRTAGGLFADILFDQTEAAA